jgi:hypothetical protein
MVASGSVTLVYGRIPHRDAALPKDAMASASETDRAAP